MAVIHADIQASTVINALRAGRISPCGGSGTLSEDLIDGCRHIVAQMGTDPIIEAIQGGADVVVAAHSLYEQPDPDCFYEPEGKVDLRKCKFEQHGPRSVKVSSPSI